MQQKNNLVFHTCFPPMGSLIERFLHAAGYYGDKERLRAYLGQKCCTA